MFVSDELQVAVSKYKTASEPNTKHRVLGIFDWLLGPLQSLCGYRRSRVDEEVEHTGPDNSKVCTGRIVSLNVWNVVPSFRGHVFKQVLLNFLLDRNIYSERDLKVHITIHQYWFL